MQATRRFWALSLLVAFLSVGGAIIGELGLLVGGAVLGGWLLAQQFLFLDNLRTTVNSLSIEQHLSRTTVMTGETVTTTLAVERPISSPRLDVAVEALPPVAASGNVSEDRIAELQTDDREAKTTFDVSMPVAGSYDFRRPVVTASDGLGLFRATVPIGAIKSIVVEPRAPRDVHIGEGGSQVATAIGEHAADQTGAGIEPETVRQYVPGDEIRSIDWKATARLNHPHVREFELETDPTTALFVDHRAAMADGPEGETKLDYAREVALAFVNSAKTLNSRIGLYTVGDDGVMNSYSPSGSADHYSAIRHAINDLRPPGHDERATWRRLSRSPTEARRVGHILGDDSTPFGTSLRPFFEDRSEYVHRVDEDPLAATVRQRTARLSDAIWSVIITDDTDRAEVRETVKLARRGNGNVMVFLTPSVLFEPGGLSDLEAAYNEYSEFETFRRSLANLERVSAFEVGPASRLSAVLSAGAVRRSSSARGRGTS
ncbi:DUF58 domain-containing protein [Halostella sp. JP-L12]|uniref:DUF58 domain-containing protein n=1 Tax=Halostella TaxID=1843185 RepID=UPI000EF7B8B6|nr:MULTISPECIES: DUF58 domain-containing protein [Halostella]NHN46429.1 DUF58 domain-containing protein [Halostella sp. JP-L12]